MWGRVRTCALCGAALLAVGVEGQSYRAFQWKFGDNYIQTSFDECQTLPVIVEPLTNATSTGVPPYYLIAFEVGGIPTTTMIGDDPQNLSWTAIHRAGTELVLTVMDANQSTGGIPASPYTMNAASSGSNSSCIPTPPTSPAVVHPNVTGTLTTCEPWGLTMMGGKKPYHMVIAGTSSPVITNVTMGDNDDVLTYIDRADPNTGLMASVVDATGQWGVSSILVHTAGSTDTDCVGLVTTSKNSTEIAQEAADRAHAAQEASNRRRTRLVAGLVVGLGVPIILGICVALWFWRRRRQPRAEQGLWDSQDVTPRPLDVSAHEMREVDAAELKNTEFARQSPTGTPLMAVEPIPPVYFDREIAEARQRSHGSATAASTIGSNGSTTSPTSPDGGSARHRKLLEASRGHLYSNTNASASSPAHESTQSLRGLPANPRPLRPNPLSPSQLIDTSLDPELQPDIIIQHRDGGVVQELPPPYADRSGDVGRSPPSSMSSPSEAHTAGPA